MTQLTKIRPLHFAVTLRKHLVKNTNYCGSLSSNENLHKCFNNHVCILFNDKQVIILKLIYNNIILFITPLENLNFILKRVEKIEERPLIAITRRESFFFPILTKCSIGGLNIQPNNESFSFEKIYNKKIYNKRSQQKIKDLNKIYNKRSQYSTKQ